MCGKSILSRKGKGKKEGLPSRRHGWNFLLECKAKRRTGEAKRAQEQEPKMEILKEYSPSLESLGKRESICQLELELEPEGDNSDPAGRCVECIELEVVGEVNITPIIILTNQIRQRPSIRVVSRYPGGCAR
jgi:hypothetical protein